VNHILVIHFSFPLKLTRDIHHYTSVLSLLGVSAFAHVSLTTCFCMIATSCAQKPHTLRVIDYHPLTWQTHRVYSGTILTCKIHTLHFIRLTCLFFSTNELGIHFTRSGFSSGCCRWRRFGFMGGVKLVVSQVGMKVYIYTIG
jgi:hypothetical protein